MIVYQHVEKGGMCYTRHTYIFHFTRTLYVQNNTIQTTTLRCIQRKAKYNDIITVNFIRQIPTAMTTFFCKSEKFMFPSLTNNSILTYRTCVCVNKHINAVITVYMSVY